MNADQMLETWGLRISGPSLKHPARVSVGGEPSVDDDLAVVRYVERIKGFAEARPVLVHVHVQGKPLTSFVPQQPGEPLTAAVERLGWWMLFDTPPHRMAGTVYRGFYWMLETALRKAPFVRPSQMAHFIDPT